VLAVFADPLVSPAVAGCCFGFGWSLFILRTVEAIGMTFIAEAGRLSLTMGDLSAYSINFSKILHLLRKFVPKEPRSRLD